MTQRAIRTWHRVRPLRHPIRLVEKTPENCLRVPFLTALFADASIIHLTRSGPASVASLMEGWRHPTLFPGYRVPDEVRIPGDTRGRWAFTLMPGWREFLDHPLEEVCAQQWIRCNEAVLDAKRTTSVPWLTVRFENLVARPAVELDRVARFAEVRLGTEQWRERSLPPVNSVTSPGPEKWRSEPGVERILPMIEPTMTRLGYAMPDGGASSR
jgi:hypothetical protein